MNNYKKFIKRYKLIVPLISVLLVEASLRFSVTFTSKAFQQTVSSIGSTRIFYALIFIVAINVCTACLTKLKWVMSTRIRENLSEKYRNDLFKSAMNMSIKDLQTFNTASLVTAIQKSTDVAEDAILLPLEFINVTATFISASVIMLTEDWVLASIMLVICIPLMILFNHIRKNLNPLINAKRKLTEKINIAISRLNGYYVIKGFANDNYEINSFNKLSKSFYNTSMKRKFMSQNAAFIVNVLNSIMDIVIVLYLIYTYDGNLADTISKSVLFYGLATSLFVPLANISGIIEDTSTFKVNLDKNTEIIEMESEYDGDIKIKDFNNSIEFRDVSFSYTDNDNTLANINLTIHKGEKVGIYGPSGGGKSTFINLINRFFKVDSGEILIDGININKLTNKSLRRLIGTVSQDIFIFSDMSIKDNIKYGINCTDEEVIEASKLANAHDFITKLENGYDSLVGNNGVLLSGGERQRIAIARLFLLNPPILILDEATSKLDNVSELAIKESLTKLSKDKTIINIAHRLTTIENSDILVGINNHSITEMGSSNYIKKHGELWLSYKNGYNE